MRPRIVALLALLGMLVGVVACGDEATPTVGPTATIEPIPTAGSAAAFEEAPCPFDLPGGRPVECGFVVLPEDHHDPAGPTIRLAVAVFKDVGAGHQPDPLMLLCGGPGERCAAEAPVVAQVVESLSAHRDLVVFDQRGVGLSEPALECPEYVQSSLDNLDEPDPEGILRSQFDALMACRDRLVSDGYDLSVYNNVQNVADVNAIRVALGYEQVNLYGGSYGSLLAQATMRDYPEGIRSVVLSSVWPLETSLSVDGPATFASAIMRLLDACAADEACNGAYPDLRNVLFEVIDRLNAEPIPITVTSPVDGQSYDALLSGDAVLGNLGVFLYVTQIIPVLPQATYDVYGGDYGLMTQLTSRRLELLDLLSRGMMFSVVCADDLIGRTSEDLRNIEAALPRQFRNRADPEVATEYGIFGVCQNWPVEEADASTKEPLVSDIPTLVLEGEFDPVTPPEYGQLVAGHLSNSYFFEFPGIGHDVTGASECARSIAGEFVSDPTRAPDAACIAEMPGVVFDLPREPAAPVLEPVTMEERGFRGLVPGDWNEEPPVVYRRGLTALDPTEFVQDAAPITAEELFDALSRDLGFDPGLESVATTELGSFVWDFFAFELRGNAIDMALAEDGARSYLVLLVSEPEERDELHEQLFLPAVEALAPIE